MEVSARQGNKTEQQSTIVKAPTVTSSKNEEGSNQEHNDEGNNDSTLKSAMTDGMQRTDDKGGNSIRSYHDHISALRILQQNSTFSHSGNDTKNTPPADFVRALEDEFTLKITAMQALIEERDETIAVANSQLLTKDRELAKMRSSLERIQTEHRKEIEGLTRAFELAKNVLDEDVTRLTSSASALSGTVEKQQAEIAQLKMVQSLLNSDLASLKAENAKLKEAVANKEAAKATQNDEIEKLQTEIASLNQKLQDVEKDSKIKLTRLEHLESQAKTDASTIVSLRAVNQKLLEEMAQRDQSVTSEIAAAVAIAVEKVKAAHAEKMSALVSKTQREKEQIRTALQKVAKDGKEKLSQDVARAVAAKEKADGAALAAEKRFSEVSKKLEDTERKLSAAEHQVAEARGKAAEAKRSSRQEVVALSQEKDVLEQKVKQISQEKAEAMERVGKLQALMKDFESKHKEGNEKALAEVNQKNEEERHRLVENAKKEVAEKLKIDFEKLMLEKITAEQQLRKKETEGLKQQIAHLNTCHDQEITKLQSQLGVKEKEIKTPIRNDKLEIAMLNRKLQDVEKDSKAKLTCLESQAKTDASTITSLKVQNQKLLEEKAQLSQRVSALLKDQHDTNERSRIAKTESIKRRAGDALSRLAESEAGRRLDIERWQSSEFDCHAAHFRSIVEETARNEAKIRMRIREEAEEERKRRQRKEEKPTVVDESTMEKGKTVSLLFFNKKDTNPNLPKNDEKVEKEDEDDNAFEVLDDDDTDSDDDDDDDFSISRQASACLSLPATELHHSDSLLSTEFKRTSVRRRERYASLLLQEARNAEFTQLQQSQKPISEKATVVVASADAIQATNSASLFKDFKFELRGPKIDESVIFGPSSSQQDDAPRRLELEINRHSATSPIYIIRHGEPTLADTLPSAKEQNGQKTQYWHVYNDSDTFVYYFSAHAPLRNLVPLADTVRGVCSVKLREANGDVSKVQGSAENYTFTCIVYPGETKAFWKGVISGYCSWCPLASDTSGPSPHAVNTTRAAVKAQIELLENQMRRIFSNVTTFKNMNQTSTSAANKGGVLALPFSDFPAKLILQVCMTLRLPFLDPSFIPSEASICITRRPSTATTTTMTMRHTTNALFAHRIEKLKAKQAGKNHLSARFANPVWQRPIDFLPEVLHPHIVTFRDIESGDVDQGHLGDCWILAAVASLAERHPFLVERLFTAVQMRDDAIIRHRKQSNKKNKKEGGQQDTTAVLELRSASRDVRRKALFATIWGSSSSRDGVHVTSLRRRQAENKLGAYRITLNVNGWWTNVIVDDYLPTIGCKPCFAKNIEDRAELWPALMEKAFAKVCGGYSSIVLGFASHSFAMLTGFSALSLALETRQAQRELHAPAEGSKVMLLTPDNLYKQRDGGSVAFPPSTTAVTSSSTLPQITPGSKSDKLFNMLLESIGSKRGQNGECVKDPTCFWSEPSDASSSTAELYRPASFGFEWAATASTWCEDHLADAFDAVGLVGGHAYSLIDAVIFPLFATPNSYPPPKTGSSGRDSQAANGSSAQHLRLVRIRNPWGNEKEWKGPWSDGCRFWKDVRYQHITSELGGTHANNPTTNNNNDDAAFPNLTASDGTFWMPFEEFLMFFVSIVLCPVGLTDRRPPTRKHFSNAAAAQITSKPQQQQQPSEEATSRKQGAGCTEDTPMHWFDYRFQGHFTSVSSAPTAASFVAVPNIVIEITVENDDESPPFDFDAVIVVSQPNERVVSDYLTAQEDEAALEAIYTPLLSAGKVEMDQKEADGKKHLQPISLKGEPIPVGFLVYKEDTSIVNEAAQKRSATSSNGNATTAAITNSDERVFYRYAHSRDRFRLDTEYGAVSIVDAQSRVLRSDCKSPMEVVRSPNHYYDKKWIYSFRSLSSSWIRTSFDDIFLAASFSAPPQNAKGGGGHSSKSTASLHVDPYKTSVAVPMKNQRRRSTYIIVPVASQEVKGGQAYPFTIGLITTAKIGSLLDGGGGGRGSAAVGSVAVRMRTLPQSCHQQSVVNQKFFVLEGEDGRCPSDSSVGKPCPTRYQITQHSVRKHTQQRHSEAKIPGDVLSSSSLKNSEKAMVGHSSHSWDEGTCLIVEGVSDSL